MSKNKNYNTYVLFLALLLYYYCIFLRCLHRFPGGAKARQSLRVDLAHKVQHYIDTGDAQPIKSHPSPASGTPDCSWYGATEEMLRAGIIKPSDRPSVSGIAMVNKKRSSKTWFWWHWTTEEGEEERVCPSEWANIWCGDALLKDYWPPSEIPLCHLWPTDPNEPPQHLHTPQTIPSSLVVLWDASFRESRRKATFVPRAVLLLDSLPSLPALPPT